MWLCCLNVFVLIWQLKVQRETQETCWGLRRETGCSWNHCSFVVCLWSSRFAFLCIYCYKYVKYNMLKSQQLIHSESVFDKEPEALLPSVVSSEACVVCAELTRHWTGRNLLDFRVAERSDDSETWMWDVSVTTAADVCLSLSGWKSTSFSKSVCLCVNELFGLFLLQHICLITHWRRRKTVCCWKNSSLLLCCL